MSKERDDRSSSAGTSETNIIDTKSNRVEPTKPSTPAASSGTGTGTAGKPSGGSDTGIKRSGGGFVGGVDNERIPSKPATGTGTGTGNNPAAGIDAGKRKRASGGTATSGKSKAATKLDLTTAGRKTIATQLVGIHKIAGLVTGQPELCDITAEQADGLANACVDVMEQYKIKPNAKAVAWANLIGVACVVYAPKVLLYKAMTAKKQAVAAPKVSPIRNAPAPAGNAPFKMNFGS